MHGITGIDHPVVAAGDMEQARATYERLGFTVPPRGSHLEWGTGNWCILFPHDYLELRGITDAAKYTHGLVEFLAERGEALMGVAFGTGDAEHSRQSLLDAGFHPPPVRRLTRNFELPEGWRQPRFALCFLDARETPGLMSVVLCQHLTPELIRRDDWLEHPNTAEAVVSMTAVVEDPPAVCGVYERLFGAAEIRGGALLCRTGPHFIHVMTPEQFQGAHGFDWQPRPPCLGAVTLRVRDLAALRRQLRSNGVPFAEGEGGAIRVGPRYTCGYVLEFISAL